MLSSPITFSVLLLLAALTAANTTCAPNTIQKGGSILILSPSSRPQLLAALSQAQLPTLDASLHKSFFTCTNGAYSVVYYCSEGILDTFSNGTKTGETCAPDCDAAATRRSAVYVLPSSHTTPAKLTGRDQAECIGPFVLRGGDILLTNPSSQPFLEAALTRRRIAATNENIHKGIFTCSNGTIALDDFCPTGVTDVFSKLTMNQEDEDIYVGNNCFQSCEERAARHSGQEMTPSGLGGLRSSAGRGTVLDIGVLVLDVVVLVIMRIY